MAADMPPDQFPIGQPPRIEIPMHQRIGQLADAERRLREVVDNLVDGIITIGEGAVIESFNPAAQRHFGYGPDDTVNSNTGTVTPSNSCRQGSRCSASSAGPSQCETRRLPYATREC